MTRPAPDWRPLSPDELAAAPERRLGGVLVLILLAAIGVLLAIGGMLAAIAVLGGLFAITLMFNELVGGSSPQTIATRLMLAPQAAMFVWAIAFVVTTLARLRSGPQITSALMIIWAIVEVFCAFALRHLNPPSGLTVAALGTTLPYALFEILLAAAYCGYMLDGRRPNIYYRRRGRAS